MYISINSQQISVFLNEFNSFIDNNKITKIGLEMLNRKGIYKNNHFLYACNLMCY